MIKKPFKTLKENPVITVFFMLYFLYKLAAAYFFPSGVFQSAIGISWLNTDTFKYISWGIKALCYIAWFMFLLPPVLLHISEIIDNNPSENWYKRGVKGYKWRVIGVRIVIWLFSGYIFVLPYLIYRYLIDANAGIIVVIIYNVLIPVISIVAQVFFQIGYAAVFAEDEFTDGISNVVKAAKKRFFSVLALIMLLSASLYLCEYAAEIYSHVLYAVSLLFGALISAFITVYCMYCCVEFKNTRGIIL